MGAAGGVRPAVEMGQGYAPFVRRIEIENFDMVKEAVEAEADIIMLDNMTHEEIKMQWNILQEAWPGIFLQI